MRKLVFDLVERFLQQEEIEQAIGVFLRARPKPGIRQGLTVGGEKGSDRVIAPSFERAGEPDLFIGCGLERALQRGGCGIIDRSNKAGDITRRRRLAAAILDAAPRLTFEIDDED